MWKLNSTAMTQLYVLDLYVITLPERAIPYTSNIIFLGTGLLVDKCSYRLTDRVYSYAFSRDL